MMGPRDRWENHFDCTSVSVLTNDEAQARTKHNQKSHLRNRTKTRGTDQPARFSLVLEFDDMDLLSSHHTKQLITTRHHLVVLRNGGGGLVVATLIM